MSQLKRHLPNALSLSRIALAAIFPFFSPVGRLMTIAIAGVSDLLDGAMSRRMGVESQVGKLLDPIADKIFVLAVLLTLLVEGALSVAMLLLIGLRDVAVILGSCWVYFWGDRRDFLRMQPRIAGKLTTVLQFFVIFSLILWQQAHGLLLWATIAMSLIAALDYVQNYMRREKLDAVQAATAA